MIKEYESPDFEFVKITLADNLLGLSDPENSGSGGGGASGEFGPGEGEGIDL